MRIAYVCADPGVPVFGNKGCSIHVQEVLRTMQRRGHQVDLFARRIDGPTPLDLESVQVIQLETPGKRITGAARERALVALNRPLQLALQQHGPYDLVYERHALWSQAGLRYAHDTATPSVLEVNAPLLHEQQTHRRLCEPELARQLVVNAFQLATTRLAVSHGVAEHIAQLSGSRANLCVLPNGVDPGRFEAARKAVRCRWQHRSAGDTPSTCVIGFAGTMRAWHGMPVLGEAFSQLLARGIKAQLLIVGDGPAKEELWTSLSSAARKSTHITGKVSHREMPFWLAQMDIGVAPYPAHEEFYFSPLKVFEYMACGMPIVASRIGDLELYFEQALQPCLVEADQPQALADRVAEFLDDPTRTSTLGQAAADRVRERFTWDHVWDSVLLRTGIQDTLATARSA